MPKRANGSLGLENGRSEKRSNGKLVGTSCTVVVLPVIYNVIDDESERMGSALC